MKSRLTPGFAIINTLLLWVATGIAATVLWPVYRDSAFIVMIVITTLLGSAIAILGAMFRWSAPIVLGVTVVTFAAFGVP